MDYQELFTKNWEELEKIGQTVQKINRFLDILAEYHEDMDSFDLMVAGISVNLQGICMGAERLLSNIANDIDGYMPTGKQWQKKLFEQMAIPISGKRPAVLCPESLAFLVELKGFKVSVRGGFASKDSEASEVIAMALKLPACHETFKADCLAFHQILRGPISEPLIVQPPLPMSA